jgi:flagellar basal body-associated protein FliL
MAEAAVSEEVQGKKGSFGKILLLGLNGILFLSGIGFFLLTKFGVFTAPTTAETQAETNTQQEMPVNGTPVAQAPPPAQGVPLFQAAVVQGSGILVELKPFVVNLRGDHRSRYLRLALQLEISTEKLEEDINKRLPQIRDRLIFLLSSKTFDEVSQMDGKYRLQDEITQNVNEVLGIATAVQKTYFTDFIVQ